MPRYTVTSALPYANGPIHFGHVAGAYLPADVYVRTLRMQGEDVLFLCGTDEHGVAITIRAEEQGLGYPEYVERWRREHRETFESLGIQFDAWSGTSVCPPHPQMTQDFFRHLDANGYLVARETEQLYCEHDAMFLADRYVLGTCYECGHENARGDECPSCGTWIEPLKLKSPRCKVCNNEPERRSTTHWYLDLPKLRDEHMGEWIENHEWKPNVAGFIKNLLEDVPERAITRDMDWGIPLPEGIEGAEGKVLYVWFDAPIGYVSFTKELLESRGEGPDAWETWWKGDDVRLVHFIGKDNIPFHCLVFPSMLHGTKQGFTLPYAVPANEFYNLKGGKFSTSDGRTIDPASLLENVEAEAVRWYIITTLPETADAEFSLEGLAVTNNADLAKNIGNLANRVLGFITKKLGGKVPPLSEEHRATLDAEILEKCGEISDPAEPIQNFRFREAAKRLTANSSVGNLFMQRLEPWALLKTDEATAASVLNTLCQYLAVLSKWMAPFLPTKAQALWEQLGCEGQVADQPWPGVPGKDDWRTLSDDHQLGTPQALFPMMDVPEGE